MDRKEWKLRKDLCKAGHRLYRAGFMAGSDGNLSVLLNEDKVLITPSRLCKGFLQPYEIIKVDRRGQKLSGDLPPSLELSMHLAGYEERSDISAVAHCHPPYLIAFTVAQQQLPSMVLPEIEVLFGGSIPLASYATPGTKELGDSIRKIVRRKETVLVLLDHHGTLAVGNDIYQAAMRTEHAENAAKVIYYARQLGAIKPLPSDAVAGLRETRANLKAMESRVFPGAHSEISSEESPKPAKQESIADQHDIESIVQKVLSEMREMRTIG